MIIWLAKFDFFFFFYPPDIPFFKIPIILRIRINNYLLCASVCDLWPAFPPSATEEQHGSQPDLRDKRLLDHLLPPSGGYRYNTSASTQHKTLLGGGQFGTIFYLFFKSPLYRRPKPKV